MSRESSYDREEEEWYHKLVESNPWKSSEGPIIERMDWILESPLVPCIPQLSSLEYNFVDRFDSNERTTVFKVSTKINDIEKLAVLKFVSPISKMLETRSKFLSIRSIKILWIPFIRTPTLMDSVRNT